MKGKHLITFLIIIAVTCYVVTGVFASRKVYQRIRADEGTVPRPGRCPFPNGHKISGHSSWCYDIRTSTTNRTVAVAAGMIWPVWSPVILWYLAMVVRTPLRGSEKQARLAKAQEDLARALRELEETD